MKQKIILFTLICIPSLSYSQKYETPFIERRSTAAQNVEIQSVEIQKNKTAVLFKVINKSTSTLSFTLYGAEDRRAHNIQDANTQKLYKQKWTLLGVAQPDRSKDFVVEANSQFTFTLYFDKLDENVKDINIIEGKGNGSGTWDFYGVKLMSTAEIANWQREKAEKEKLQQELIANKKQQEKDEREKRKIAEQNERQAKAEANRKQQVEELNNQLADAKGNTQKNTTTTLTFDGVYSNPSSGKYIRIKPAQVKFGKFGHCVGSYSDINRFKDFFTTELGNQVLITSNTKTFILIGKDLASVGSQFYISEVENFKNRAGWCIRDEKTQISYGSFADEDKPIYVPTMVNANQYSILPVNKRTINDRRVDLVLESPLESGKDYVLFQQNAGKFFYFRTQ